MIYLDTRRRYFAVFFSLCTGIILACGFLPAATTLFGWIWIHLDLPNHWRLFGKLLAFPILAVVFYLTLSREKFHGPPVTVRSLLSICVVPWAIAAAFGLFVNSVPILDMQILWWYIFLAPLGEEFLFRGWLYGMLERIWPKKMFSATNPLPVALWGSAIAFSIWHVQNHFPEPYAQLPFTFFQVAYTLVVGVWLGYLRWKTGRLALPIMAHVILNGLGVAVWKYLSDYLVIQ